MGGARSRALKNESLLAEARIKLKRRQLILGDKRALKSTPMSSEEIARAMRIDTAQLRLVRLTLRQAN